MHPRLRPLGVLLLVTVMAVALGACGTQERHPDAAADETTAGGADAAVSRDGLPSKKQWLRDVARAMEGSGHYLDRRVDRARAQGRPKLAIVLDIDNTSLASHYAWPRPVKRVRGFAAHANRKGVTVLFATARPGSSRSHVKRALRNAGYSFARICTRKDHEGIVAGKVRCRKSFEHRGFTLIAMVGNRRTDFRGGHFDRAFRLPSYGGRLG